MMRQYKYPALSLLHVYFLAFISNAILAVQDDDFDMSIFDFDPTNGPRTTGPEKSGSLSSIFDHDLDRLPSINAACINEERILNKLDSVIKRMSECEDRQTMHITAFTSAVKQHNEQISELHRQIKLKDDEIKALREKIMFKNAEINTNNDILRKQDTLDTVETAVATAVARAKHNISAEYEMMQVEHKYGAVSCDVVCTAGRKTEGKLVSEQLLKDPNADAAINGIKALVHAGHDINELDKHNRSILHIAAQYGQLDTLKFAFTLSKCPCADIDVENKDEWGRTVLLVVPWDKDWSRGIKKFEFLRSVGSDLNALNKAKGSMAHLAAQYGHGEMVKYLLNVRENGKYQFPTKSGNWGCPVISFAAKNVNGIIAVKTIKSLVQNGADINASCDNGFHLLGVSAQYGSFEVFQYLSDMVGKPNVTFDHSRTGYEIQSLLQAVTRDSNGTRRSKKLALLKKIGIQ